MKLSKRMQAVASMVSGQGTLADIGTDHGYVPILLVEQHIIDHAIACDINRGPLMHARENIKMHGLEDRIETRLADGLEKINPGEADTILIAGIGGDLLIRILERGEACARSARELVLQPQSELRRVRKYLREHGYLLVDEDMILEDGKYYPMMRAVPVDEIVWDKGMDQAALDACDTYGPILLKNGNPVLRKFLVREHKQYVTILETLNRQPQNEGIINRIRELEQMMNFNESAYSIIGDVKNAGI